jgi:hypothetical protein
VVRARVVLELAELAVDLRQRFFDRLHERVDGFLARQIALRALLGLLERGGRGFRNVVLVLSALAPAALKASATRDVRVRELVGGGVLLLGAPVPRPSASAARQAM